jgi:hypothetical protein
MISYIILAFIAGAFIGAAIATVMLGLCMAAGDADERLGYK